MQTQKHSFFTDTGHFCKKVVFVTGAGHSGTTLLGMMLGSGTGVLYAGEIQNCKLVGNEKKPERKRICRACKGDTCPVWGNFKMGGNVYETLAQRSERSIVVDTSKRIPEWIEPQSLELRDTPHALVIVVRDPRGVVASNMRKHPEISPKNHALEWGRRIRSFEALAKRFKGPVVHVRYEELVRNTENTLKAICDGIKVPFEKAMLNPWEAEHHPLRGNLGTQSIAFGSDILVYDNAKRDYYATHPQAIVLDMRWKNELSDAALQEIKQGAGDVYEKYTQGNYYD